MCVIRHQEQWCLSVKAKQEKKLSQQEKEKEKENSINKETDLARA